jgi:hypothetical protein
LRERRGCSGGQHAIKACPRRVGGQRRSLMDRLASRCQASG